MPASKHTSTWSQWGSRFRPRLIGLWVLVMVFFPACNLLQYNASDSQQTLVAVRVQQTALALTQAIQTELAKITPATPVPTLIDTPIPMPSPLPDETPLPTSVEQMPISDLERQMMAARILLFEDMSASRYLRYVKEALDKANYFYLDVGSAKGWFKTQLLSNTEWDLIIASAEARRDFGGEFFDYIDQRLEQGAAAIIEFGDLDSAPNGISQSLLRRCGVRFQDDWLEPEMRVFFWTQPDHPVFNEPNKVPLLGNAEQLWKGDLGDLLQIRMDGGQPGGDALILASTNPGYKTDHGLLVNCLGGRLIIQTFASHEYRYADIIPLWQNYVYQALKNRFAVLPPLEPIPAFTLALTNTPEPTSTGPTPQPGFGDEYTCASALTGRILSPPKLQTDLFEHHAEGTFLIVKLQLVNQTAYPIQVWAQDYFVEGEVYGQPISYSPHKAATGYLYIDSPSHLWQDLIAPGIPWSTSLAFDVNPNGQNWVLVVKPGSQLGAPLCEMRIPLLP
ncbi:MAG: hypothetical protein JXB15_08535 [Anaerolineales bacterium]|nr:hypothetical protein [Anaerolineales bacterium]